MRAAGLRANMLSGHFSFPKYRDLFPDSPVISFFRNPVDRVVSEFVHFKNHHHYQGSLEEFYRSTRFQNRQHKSLGGARPTDLDFYGITEEYERSITRFNEKFDIDLKIEKLNKGNYQKSFQNVAPTRQQLAEIKHLNQADVALYQLALDQFEQQDTQSRISKKSVIRYKGNLGGVRKDKLYGWAFDRESTSPTVLKVSVNGEKRLELTANVERPDIVQSGLRKNSRCGFVLPISELGSLAPYDSISIQTVDGRYELLNSPLVYAA